MKEKSKKLKLQFATNIQVKPILSTIKYSQSELNDAGGKPILYEMQVKVEGSMTAIASMRKENFEVIQRDTEAVLDRNEDWLFAAIANGEVEIELINNPTPPNPNYKNHSTGDEWMKGYSGPSNREIREDYRSAFDGSDGVSWDGEAL